MTPDRTPEGKVVLFSAATGQRFERWPVDARGMLESGEYTTAPSATPAVPPAIDPVPHVTQSAKENAALSPTGAPLVISPKEGVTAAAPVQLPTGGRQKRAKN